MGGRCLDVASGGQVMGQQFRLAFDEIGTSQRRNTEVRLTHRWRGESGANQSLKWDFLGRELRLDSKTFMDDVGRERTLFGAWIDQISLCVSRLLALRCRFKSLKLLLFMPTAGLTAGQFPVYKKLRRPYHPRM